MSVPDFFFKFIWYKDFSFLIPFAICSVGDSGVGKSCLVLRFTSQEFQSSIETTIGIEFGSKIISWNDKTIKLQIWDTAGQESFRSISRAYYRGAIGALVVFDATKKESFQHVQDWIQDIREHGEESTRLMLVAHKSDLETARQIPTRVAQEFAFKNNMLYIETSAKSGQNVDQAFLMLASSIYKEVGLERAHLWSDTEIKAWDAKGIKLGFASSNTVKVSSHSPTTVDSFCC